MTHFCNPAAAYEEGMIADYGHDGRYPKHDLEAAIAPERCRYGGVAITGTCRRYPDPSGLPSAIVNLDAQFRERENIYIGPDALRESLMEASKSSYTVTLRHPYSDHLFLVQFDKINIYEYRIIQWNVHRFACCHSRYRDSEMFNRILTGDEVTKVIYDIVASNEVDLPNAPVPIVFQSSTGDEVTVHLRK